MRGSTRLATICAFVATAALVAAGCGGAAPAPTQVPAVAPTKAPAAAAQPTTAPAAAQPTTAAQPTAAAAAKPATNFPSRPIEFVVPFAPGGGSGITAETINKIVTEGKLSPQPLSISYKPGASGQIGWAYLAGRKGDGHAIATATSSFTSGPLLGQSPLKLEEFTPIAGMALDQNLMVTFPNSPYKTIQEVIEAAKKAPKSIKVAGTSAAGSDATVSAMLENAAGVKFNLIPFNSGAEVNAAILGGQVDLAISNPNEFLPNIEGGKLRPLVIFSDARMPMLKDVPTAKEVGYNVVLVSARGILAPAGIPKDQEQWLIDLMKKVTESPGWKDYSDKNAMTVKFMGGAEYGKFLADERSSLEATFKSMGLIK